MRSVHNPHEPVVVLLAAGKSQRFGDNKLAVCLADNKTVIQQSYSRLRTLSRNILVVVNSFLPSTEQALHNSEVDVLSLPSEGMGQSIAAAVRYRASDVGWVLYLADMPFIREQTLASFMREIQLHPNSIIRPRYGQTAGHPVFFPARFYKELSGLGGDTGAREILLQHTEAVRWLDVDDIGILRDIDKKEDIPG